MKEALALAREAAARGETPVGCVVVDEKGRVIGRGSNRTEELSSATRHAEMEAIEQASKAYGWRLDGCSLYVTMEPCPMCAGAILNSRVSKLFYGVKDKRAGSCGSVINLFMENYGRSPQITGGIMEEECAVVLTEFFKKLR